MPQISKGWEYQANGPLSEVTADNLNALADNATLRVGSIKEQNETVLSYDTDEFNVAQSTSLARITKGNLLKNVNSTAITTTDLTTTNLTATATTTGTLNVTGNMTLAAGTISGTTTFSGNTTFSGDANFTGNLKVNGTVGYVLTEIFEHTIPPYIALVGGQINNIYTSPTFTKPTGEIWVIEMQAMHSGKGGYVYEFAVRYGSQTPTTGSYIGYERFHDGAGGGAHCVKMYLNRWVFDVNATFTNETIRVDCSLGNGSEFQFAPTNWQYGGFVSNVMATPSRFRIYKYKTA